MQFTIEALEMHVDVRSVHVAAVFQSLDGDIMYSKANPSYSATGK